ncbi:hypothetical protein RAS1_00980 [Phycisphaerae bacterium RAS1]|nr:hypothetical protein RAS1_00980 [Phycisphaerae bacterium RAS1]
MAEGKIVIRCDQCGSRLKAPESAVGRKIRCPRCQHVLVVPGAEEPTPIVADDPLDSLAAAESSAQAISTPTLKASPPPTEADSNWHVGQSAATIASAGGALVGMAARVGGRFALGCLLSLVGALLGAALWAGVAVGTGYEIGYIAWGVGIAAGVGMPSATASPAPWPASSPPAFRCSGCWPRRL